ncbi:DNA-processing protein DprA [Rhodoferax antarcticus]|uniref:DNA-processing protein DprA n=1 Tax=Rhodoferax antarcticus TaxID=81479 RepID=UPI0022253A6A|nr:DNA-processing protein DprA [Rhodoferax antarcticus]MCW2310694.1 putative Rossmann fold nucleotide-binding protein DprA/Smf involved in DNA uptake [Rhodoferax antarcticus]
MPAITPPHSLQAADAHTPALAGQAVVLTAGDAAYPPQLLARLGQQAPTCLTLVGNASLLTLPKTALFCSARCPGSAILPAYDQAARWRDGGRCIISGFHSPVESECLRILLRGTSPVIICPARGPFKRVPPDWQKALDAGNLLIVSAFPVTEVRVTAELARKRNEVVAALANEAWFAHITPGGNNDLLSASLGRWGLRIESQNV